MSEQNNNVEMTVEQILAAVLHKIGPVELTGEQLFTDYSSYAVAVDPASDGKVTFTLVDIGVAEGELDDVSE
jgi:hypothetical protein